VLFAKQKWSKVACILAGLMLIPSIAEANKQPSVNRAKNADKAVVVALSSYPPVLREIARCESGFRQFDANGNPLKNPGSSATGVFQIMYSLHHKAAKKRGWDIRTTKGNLAYAKHLYNTEGTAPWNASKHCWG
jgi:hypothetical protein